ncbi:MAG: hypothetical protein L0221_03985 [Chloroflexi bacterium]|nr:hypothetical protein [Chloroflexota bacterium]
MGRSRERPNDSWQVSIRAPDGSRRRRGLWLGPVRITPLRVALAIALVGSAAFNAFAVVFVRDERQIPMLSSGFLVMSLVFGALTVGGGIATWRAGADGRTRDAMLFAVGGGIAGIAGAGCFAAAVVLALLWGG